MVVLGMGTVQAINVLEINKTRVDKRGGGRSCLQSISKCRSPLHQSQGSSFGIITHASSELRTCCCQHKNNKGRV